MKAGGGAGRLLVRHTTFLEGNSFPARKDLIQCSLVRINMGCMQVNDWKRAVLKH